MKKKSQKGRHSFLPPHSWEHLVTRQKVDEKNNLFITPADEKLRREYDASPRVPSRNLKETN